MDGSLASDSARVFVCCSPGRGRGDTVLREGSVLSSVPPVLRSTVAALGNCLALASDRCTLQPSYWARRWCAGLESSAKGRRRDGWERRGANDVWGGGYARSRGYCGEARKSRGVPLDARRAKSELTQGRDDGEWKLEARQAAWGASCGSLLGSAALRGTQSRWLG